MKRSTAESDNEFMTNENGNGNISDKENKHILTSVWEGEESLHENNNQINLPLGFSKWALKQDGNIRESYGREWLQRFPRPVAAIAFKEAAAGTIIAWTFEDKDNL